MNTTANTSSPYQPFANAYAGLLQQLSTIEPIAKLDAYQKNVVGQPLEKIASQQLIDDISIKANREAYEANMLKAADELTQKIGDTAKLWENTSHQVQELNSQLAQLDESQKISWLQSQGVDVTAENFAQKLNEKVMEFITNPTPAIEAAQAIIPPAQEVVADAASTELVENLSPDAELTAPKSKGDVISTENQPKPEEAHKHDLQDSVVNFVSTLLTAAKGEECTITREEAGELINRYYDRFSTHSREHYTHTLMESVDNFKAYDRTVQGQLVCSLTNKHPKDLTGSDIIANLDEIGVISPPAFVDMINSAKAKVEKKGKAETKKPLEESVAHSVSDEAKPEGAKEISMAERVKNTKELAKDTPAIRA